jgi:hypothetical protein
LPFLAYEADMQYRRGGDCISQRARAKGEVKRLTEN